MKCETAYWLPKWRFRSYRLRGCLDSLLAQLFFPWSKLWLVFEWFAEKSFRLDGMETIKGEYWFLTFTSKNCVIFLCRTRQVSREEKTLKSFLDMSPDKWVEASYEVCWILNVNTQKMDDVIYWINHYHCRVTRLISLMLIHWLLIYPMESAIQRLNNNGQTHSVSKIFTVAM